MLETEPSDDAALGDEKLLGQFIDDHDQSAFGELVRRHGPMVLAVCRRSLGSGAGAEDAFQATFLVLAMRAGSIRARGALAGWLWQVARQTATSMRLAEQRRRVRERHYAETAMQSETPAEDPEVVEILEKEVDRLSPRHRTPVVMCYLEGKSNREAVRLLGMPIGTVATLLREGANCCESGFCAGESAGRRKASAAICLRRSRRWPYPPRWLSPLEERSRWAHPIRQWWLQRKWGAIMAYGKAKTVAIGAIVLLIVGGTNGNSLATCDEQR